MKQQLSNCNTETITSSYLRTRTRTNLLSSLLFLLFIGITQTGCDDNVDCALIDCFSPNPFLELNVLQDGQDIIFGMSPLITPEEISIQSEENGNASLVILEDKVGIRILNSDRITIEVGTLRTLTIDVQTQNISDSECCPQFIITSIEQDGETLCEAACTDLDIVIE